jgi:hypothetical protein
LGSVAGRVAAAVSVTVVQVASWFGSRIGIDYGEIAAVPNARHELRRRSNLKASWGGSPPPTCRFLQGHLAAPVPNRASPRRPVPRCGPPGCTLDCTLDPRESEMAPKPQFRGHRRGSGMVGPAGLEPCLRRCAKPCQEAPDGAH